jgi:hypothetical protein
LVKGGPLRSEHYVIPAENHTIQSVTVSQIQGVAPSNTMLYPLVIPVGNGKIFSAAKNTGMGQSILNFHAQLLIPAEAAAGKYAVTLNFSLVSGP